MKPNFHHQNQAFTILAIATASIGFGLFGADFQTGGALLESGPGSLLARIKLGFAGLALLFYGTLLILVRQIMIRDGSVNGRQVANGPLTNLYLVLAYIALIFVVGVIEEPAT